MLNELSPRTEDSTSQLEVAIVMGGGGLLSITASITRNQVLGLPPPLCEGIFGRRAKC